MINKYTQDNILELMKNIPAITREQMIRFFSDSLDPSKINVLIDDLIATSFLTLHEDIPDCITTRFTTRKKANIVERFIDAFWPIVYMGSQNVEMVVQSYYPIQYFVIGNEIDENGEEDITLYDFTLCDSDGLAKGGMIARKFYSYTGEVDDIQHIAIIHKESDIAYLKGYGYDTACIVNRNTHEIRYVEL